MRKKTLLLSAATAIIYLTTTSYSTGPALTGSQGNKTGSPGTQTCASCHSGGSGTTGKIELRKKDQGPTSTPVTSYEAGKTYIVTLTGTNANLTHFGFQLVTLNSSNAYRGTYSNLPSNVHIAPTSTNDIVEHGAALAKDAGGNYTVSFDWTAPTGTNGPLNMYAIINAVNNDHSMSGDAVSPTLSLALTEATSSVNDINTQAIVKAYPNPVQNKLTVKMDNATMGMYDVTVVNYMGAVVSNSQLAVQTNSLESNIDAAAWAPGLYFIQIIKDGDKRVIPVVKQ